MKISPLLLSCAVIFWGMESGNLIIGCAVAVLVGSVMLVKKRWTLSESDFAGISDFTSVIFIMFIAVILQYGEELMFIKALVIWLPLILSPLIAAQLYTDSEKIVIGTRIGFRKKKLHKHSPIDFRCYYLLTCLFSAAVANSGSPVFLPVTALIIFLLLWMNRGRSAPLYIFLFLCSVTAVGGYFGSRGAESMHETFRVLVRTYIREYFASKYADPFWAHLSFGHIGKLKPSGKIIMRVKTSGNTPGRLKIASYETYNKQIWHSSRQFDYLPIRDSGWDLLPLPHDEGDAATIEMSLPKEKGLLPQPYGSFRVSGATIYELDQKADGVTRILDGAKLATYTILYHGQLVREDDLPGPRALIVHPDEQSVIKKVADSLLTADLSIQQRVEVVKQYFTDGFFYSLQSAGKGVFETHLENFLFGIKAGYCEMYATATTLLLRELGIPSRYVTGFVVSEYSGLEERYIVRERHAHAWTEAFIDNRWTVVDTTPAVWLEQDTENRSGFESLRDLISYLKYLYDSFMLRVGQEYKHILFPVVIILAALLAYSIYRRMKIETTSPETALVHKEFVRADSPFYAVEDLLAARTPRFEDEKFLCWIKRIDWLEEGDLNSLTDLYGLHRQLRYDPAGLSAADMALLQEGAALFLAESEQRLEGGNKKKNP